MNTVYSDPINYWLSPPTPPSHSILLPMASCLLLSLLIPSLFLLWCTKSSLLCQVAEECKVSFIGALATKQWIIQLSKTNFRFYSGHQFPIVHQLGWSSWPPLLKYWLAWLILMLTSIPCYWEHNALTIDHGKIKLVLTWYILPRLLVFIVQEGAWQATGEKSHQHSCPAVNSVGHSNYRNDQIYSLVQEWVANRFKANPTRQLISDNVSLARNLCYRES